MNVGGACKKVEYEFQNCRANGLLYSTIWRDVDGSRAGELRVIDVGAQPEPEFIFIAHTEGRRPSAKLRALADHLVTAFGKPPYWDEDVGGKKGASAKPK